MFISFEGIDFCGKSTQIALLEKYFLSKGRKFKTVREPGGTDFSEQLREILLFSKHDIDETTEIFLFSASRSYLVNHLINQEITSGNIVICDRFFDSTLAYQGYGRGGNISAIKSINSLAAGNTIPDITFFIDIPPEEMAKRSTGSSRDRIEESGLEFYRRVAAGYKIIAAENPGRIVEIDGIRPVDEVFAKIIEVIEKYDK